MTFPDTDLDIGFHVYFGADPADAPGTWPAPTDLSSRVARQPVLIRTGRGEGQETAGAGSCIIVLENTDGALTPLMPTSPYYPHVELGTPAEVFVDNVGSSPPYTRATGFISAIKAVMVPGAGDTNISAVQITLSGVQQRIAQGAVAKSALRHTLEPNTHGDGSYWPLEDGGEATQAAPGNTTTEYPMTVVGEVVFASDSDLAGSQPLPDTSAGSLIGEISGISDATVWRAEFLARTAFGASPIFRVTSGSAAFATLDFYPPSAAGQAVRVIVTSSTLATTVTITGTAVAASWENEWHHIGLVLQQNGANIDWDLRVDNVSEATGSTAGTMGLPHVATVNPAYLTFAADSFGHVNVISEADTSAATEAMHGYPGELAHARVERVADEAGLLVTIVGDNSVAMGSQPVATTLEILRDCEKADFALLFESLDFGMTFRTHTARENLDAAITVDLSAYRTTSGTQAAVLAPVYDTQRLRNEWTVSRPSGSSAVARDQASIDMRRRFEDETTDNVATDEQLAHQASWRVHRDATPRLRYPTTPLDIGANPSTLLQGWLDFTLGDRVDRTDMLAEHPPDDVSIVVEGYSETIRHRGWSVGLTGPRYEHWEVAEYGAVSPSGTGPDRYGADGSELFLSVDEDDTSFIVSPGDRRWTTDTDDFDPDLRLIMGGEVFDVSSIATGTSFIGAGTPAHGNNASVAPTKHASTATNDTMYLVAAIRNSGTGTVNDVSEWDSQATFGNVCVFSRTADGTAADAPTVTFSGGVANATTSAQIYTFRNVSAGVDTTATQLNSSAANIAVPGFTMDTDVGLAIAFLWKQDDYTSVTPPSSFQEGAEASTTTGDDQSLYMAYWIQTDRTQYQGGTATVTGGANAISRAIVLTFQGTQIMTVSARSVNGVVKSHDASDGIEVRLARDAIYAL